MTTDEKLKEWLESRPPVIKELVAQCPPSALYRLTTTKHTVFIYAYHEDGTLTVVITKDLNPMLLLERRVFGIKPEELERIDQ